MALDIIKSLSKNDLQSFAETLMQELTLNEEMIRQCYGLLASSYDLIGQMAISLHAKNNHSVRPKQREVVNAIDNTFSNLTSAQQTFIKRAVNFHYAAEKLNALNAPLIPAWRDDYPVSEIATLDFTSFINRYY